jgi:hypothetical protein
MVRRLLYWVEAVFVLEVSLACGSTTDTGLPANKPLAQASQAEINMLCMAHESDATDIARGNCVAEAFADTRDCKQAQSKCDVALKGVKPMCDHASQSELASCKVTLGELEGCLDSLASYFRSYRCDSANQSASSTPACFTDITKACPDLFGAKSPSQGSSSDPGSNPGSVMCMPGSMSTPRAVDDPCPQTNPQCPAAMGYVAVSTCQSDGTWSPLCACVKPSGSQP